jgi:hypothetical protein
MGLSHIYQFGNTGKVCGDMQFPIDEHAILSHVGGNANGIKTYPNDKGMISMNSNLRGLQAGSVSIIESSVEWQEFEWRDNTYQTIRKIGDARVEYSTSKTKFEGDINQVEPSRLHLAIGRTGLSIQEVMPLAVDAEGMSHMGGKWGKRLTYIIVHRVCDQNDPGDTTAWKQKHSIQYEDDTARVGEIHLHKQTLVYLEYFIHKLRNKEHDVAISIDANQNDRRCYRPQGHVDHFE